jgi:hypothetical protein
VAALAPSFPLDLVSPRDDLNQMTEPKETGLLYLTSGFSSTDYIFKIYPVILVCFKTLK